MTERSRLEALKQAGLMAWYGLKTAVTGVDVVIDPNEPPEAPAPGTEAGSAEEASPPLPPPGPVGTAIGRRAMAAAEHRVGSAQMVQEGAAMATAELLAQVPLTLALYPGPAASLVERVLGLSGHLLPADGDLEVEATAHDLAWLPLEMGRQIYGRVAGGRLAAVGGYRRAALVRFAAAAERGIPGLWCALGDDALLPLLSPEPQGAVLMEAPEKLWRVLERGEAGAALLGGELLERALRLPGAAVVAEVFPAEGLVPVWGLFSSGRVPALAPVDGGHLRIAPVPAEGAAEA